MVSLCFLTSYNNAVAPHAGAWIETGFLPMVLPAIDVAPHAGAWIETIKENDDLTFTIVAPHAGAWIETAASAIHGLNNACRASRRRVD